MQYKSNASIHQPSIIQRKSDNHPYSKYSYRSTNNMSFDLSNPDRPIEVGVILMGETEILDVAPIDFLHGMSKKFISALPLSDELKAKSFDLNTHWITEKGTRAKLTANMTLEATVWSPICIPCSVMHGE
jgi:hypothetical protein